MSGVEFVGKVIFVNPVRNFSGALNPAGIILKSNPVAEQRGIISNGVNLLSKYQILASREMAQTELFVQTR